MVVLYATLFLSLGLIDFDVRRPGWWRAQRFRLAVGVPLVFAYVYVVMPPLVFPQAFAYLLLTLIPNAVYTIALATRTAVLSRRIVSIRRTPVWRSLIATVVVAAFAGILAVLPIVDASGLRDVTQATVTSDSAPAAELTHVRVVPVESAIFSGNKVVGQLGAYYHVGTFNVQSASGRLVWVAPLDYQGVVQWLARRTSPGVVVVSAENPDAPAELRQRAPMRYVPSAMLNENLERHVYLTYGTEQILETTLQLDDHGDPRYVATLGRPTIGWSGQRVTAVVIIDPSTGAMERIPRDRFNAVPLWASRLYPADLALAYNDWFGRYIHGWWNARIARRDVHLPARDEVFGMLVAGGRFVWFVDHTSPATTDNSMTGFTYMDSRSGALTYFTASGGQFNSTAAESAVGANALIRQGRLIPTQPLLYNAVGRTTWVVPVVADNGKFQNVALVEASNGHVIVGNGASASPATDAFDAYRTFLGVSGASPPEKAGALTGTIDRIGTAPDGTIYFTLTGDRQIFALQRSGEPGALLARSGDHVRFVVTRVNGRSSLAGGFHDDAVGR